MTGWIYGEKGTRGEGGTARPRPLRWLGKRLLVLALASGSVGYAFHLFGTWPLGIVAVVTPVFGWIALVLAMQRRFGVSPTKNAGREHFDVRAESSSHRALVEANLQNIEQRRLYGR